MSGAWYPDEVGALTSNKMAANLLGQTYRPLETVFASMNASWQAPLQDIFANALAPLNSSMQAMFEPVLASMRNVSPVPATFFPEVRSFERMMLASMPDIRPVLVPPGVLRDFNALVGLQLPEIRLAALGALGAAVRDAGLEDVVEGAAAEVDGLNDVAQRSGESMEWAHVSGSDVVLGVKAVMWFATAYVAVWLATGDDAARWSVETFLSWLGLAGAPTAAGKFVERRLGGSQSE